MYETDWQRSGRAEAERRRRCVPQSGAASSPVPHQRCAIGAVAAAVADCLAKQQRKSPAKSKLLRGCGSTGETGGAPPQAISARHLIETTARPFRPHPQHRKRGSRLRRLVVGTPYLV